MPEDLLDYSEMVTRTKEFYNSLNIDIPEERLEEAVISLSMPKYVEEFNKDKDNIKNHVSLKNDHRALATVGDAICEACWMKEKYTIDSTSGKLTKEKQALTNVNFNIIGKKFLDGILFARGTDLISSNPCENKKSYATAFEAVIGFISLFNLDSAFKIVKEKLEDEKLIIK